MQGSGHNSKSRTTGRSSNGCAVLVFGGIQQASQVVREEEMGEQYTRACAPCGTDGYRIDVTFTKPRTAPMAEKIHQEGVVVVCGCQCAERCELSETWPLLGSFCAIAVESRAISRGNTCTGAASSTLVEVGSADHYRCFWNFQPLQAKWQLGLQKTAQAAPMYFQT